MFSGTPVHWTVAKETPFPHTAVVAMDNACVQICLAPSTVGVPAYCGNALVLVGLVTTVGCTVYLSRVCPKA